ncbi:uncharacterized protein LOC34622224 [Cyclospora cayetanensis]|uniref:Uncharacterized protein LOC34622224 n=1 Tax=Cyclospora cayetanensis TaxID=88456 RepID=A0A6P6S2E6_9EIME|nr:uncharacterized protein LOC34622224 [Cyclospora cayetanensis]
MARIGAWCKGAPAEAERLPARVPLEMQQEIERTTLLTSKEIQGLYDRYRKYAPNGRLLFSRFCDTLGVLGMLDDTMIAERMFRAFDQNKDGELSFTEFATALGIMMRGKDDEKLDLSFKILNPTYSGTGECLEDYRSHSASSSDTENAVPADPPRNVDSRPAGSRASLEGTEGDAIPGDGDVAAPTAAELSSSQDVRSVSEEGPEIILPRSFGVSCSTLKGQQTRPLAATVSSPARGSRDMRWFERHKAVIYADSLGLEEFMDLVRCLQASRRALLGGEGIVAPDEDIATVFLPLASEMPDGSRRMLLRDFKRAVLCSPRFLCLLGVVSNGGAAPSFYPDGLIAARSDRRPSLLSATAPSAQGAPARGRQSSADLRASVRAELLRRVRQAEARAEQQQRKLHQQQREQLEELAKSLREVERDVEAVKVALAQEAPKKSLPVSPKSPAAEALLDTLQESPYGRLCSSPVRDIPSREEVSLSARKRPVLGSFNASVSPAARSAHAWGGALLERAVCDASPPPVASAATAAAAAAVAALQQAEKQLNRILEESSCAVPNPLIHIADQLLIGLGSSMSLDSSHNILLSGDAFQGGQKPSTVTNDLPNNPVRRSLLLPKLTAEPPGRSLDESQISPAGGSTMMLSEGSKRHKVYFADGQQRASCEEEAGMSHCRQTAISSPISVAEGLALFSSAPNAERIGSSTDIATADVERSAGKEAKGFVVHFGHQSWNMVINIMVGIRLAGGRAMSEPHRAVEPYDFLMKEKFSVLPKTGMVDKQKRKAALCAVRFIDYAPMVFRRLRAIFGIDSLLYIRSVGPEQLLGNLILGNLASLSELVSEGKSGSLFYYTTDGRFMIKTVSKETAIFMRSILFDYYKHVSTCSNTLLTRFCGLHALRLKDKSGQIFGLKEPWRRKTYFMVMENFFHTPVEIHRRYDLKGSTQGRSLPPELLGDSTVARKDNDIIRDGELASLTIEIGPERKQLFIDQLTIDATFLRDHGIMDYSLLLGISYAHRTQDFTFCQNGTLQIDEEARFCQFMSPAVLSAFLFTGTEFERPFWCRDLGGLQSTDRTRLYYMGIIDILTHWNSRKKVEHIARVLQTGNASGVSCVNPTQYAQRFVDFISRHTV